MATNFRQGIGDMISLMASVKKIPKDMESNVKNLVEDTSKRIVIDAVNNIRSNGSTNYGALMQSVQSLPKNNGLGQEIFVGVEYAPNIEFGTKSKVRIPAGLESYASQFKGTPQGGTWDEFLASILDWVKKKGITGVYSVKTRKRLTGAKYGNDAEDERVAYLIARSIYLHGVTAKPFFFPAWFKNSEQFKTELTKMFKRTLLQRIKSLFTGKYN